MKKLFFILSFLLVFTSVLSEEKPKEMFREESMRRFEVINKTIQLDHATVDIYNYGTVKLHAFQTHDFFDTFVFILEKDGQAVLLESPFTKTSYDELIDYIVDLGYESIDLIVSYHPLGAKLMNTNKLKFRNIYSMKHAVENYLNGPGAGSLVPLKSRFGDNFDETVYRETIMLEEGENNIAGIKFIMRNVDFAFDAEIPEINSAHLHMLGHDKHTLVFSREFLDTYIAQLKDYKAKGYDMFFPSHGEPETRGDLSIKIRYLEDLKEAVNTSKSRQEFIDKMNVYYADYGWSFYLQGTANFLFGMN